MEPSKTSPSRPAFWTRAKLDEHGVAAATPSDGFGRSLRLLRAAERGDMATVQGLASHWARSALDHRGRDALMLASIAGHAECVEVLLGRCDRSARDHGGRTALMLAAEHGRYDCLALLLRADGGALDEPGDSPRAIEYAIFSGCPDCVGLLIPASDLGSRGALGLTPLMHAALDGRRACAEMLARSSDLGARSVEGLTAADLARYASYLGIANMLDGIQRVKTDMEAVAAALSPRVESKPSARARSRAL
jgi:ankyrin repeat protein